MLRNVIVAALLCSSFAAATPTKVSDVLIKERATRGLGKTRRAAGPKGTPPVYCDTEGEVLEDSGLILPIPESGTCHFPTNGCVQYTCYTEDSIHNAVSVCGFAGSGGADGESSTVDCSVVYHHAQAVGEQCGSTASLLVFTGGTYESGPDSLGFGFNVSLANVQACNNPLYGGGKDTDG